MRSRHRVLAKRICWCQLARACASRRTGASRSSSADSRRLRHNCLQWGRREAPLFRQGSWRRMTRMRFRGGLLALALSVAPLAAEAQPFQGLYIGAGAGYNLPENDPLSGGGQIEPHGGFVGLGSVGYALGNGFRFELEGNFREAPLQGSNSTEITSGHLRTYGAMANVLFDMDVGLPWLYPYVGGGAGYAWSNFSRQRTFTAAVFPALSANFNQTEGNFAFQA